jgi:hypothetical protein
MKSKIRASIEAPEATTGTRGRAGRFADPPIVGAF